MNKNPYCLSLDVGTSSMKALAVFVDGRTDAFRAAYSGGKDLLENWTSGINACIRMCIDRIGYSPFALSLCAQVGTYLIHARGESSLRLIKWEEGGAKKALRGVLKSEPPEFFMEQISMAHPRLESYPLVRLNMLMEQEPDLYRRIETVYAPKDYLYEYLTGERCSDAYTWRGLANLYAGAFSEALLDRFGIRKNWLAPLYRPWEAPGKLRDEIADQCGMERGLPVYVGCNDFFAAVLGMGANEESAFDVTGTSEHLGVIAEKERVDTLICSPYFWKNAAYGVTASSGVSMRWAMEQFPEGKDSFAQTLDSVSLSTCAAPIFLPYLQGERAPIWDSSARGVFFGLETFHGPPNLYYSVMEGVAFSIRQIWDSLGDEQTPIQRILAGGGAAKDSILNRIKASLLNKPVVPVQQSECGALGAGMFALYGAGLCSNLRSIQKIYCRTGEAVMPDPSIQDSLEYRYRIFRELYPNLREQFSKWHPET